MPFKYFDGIEKAQRSLTLGDRTPPFDLERMRGHGLKNRIAATLLERPDWWLAILRRLAPRLSLGGVVLLTRYADVEEVLERPDDFETPYGPEMREIAGGEADFILGLKSGEIYTRQKQAVLCAFPPDEIEGRVRPMARAMSEAIVNRAGRRFDAAGGLMHIVPVQIVRDYFGVRVEDERLFGDWALALSTLIFGDPGGDRTTRELAVNAAENLLAAIDASLDDALAGIGAADRPIDRLAGMVGSGDIARADVRAIMMGMIVGFTPTILLGGVNCLDVALDRPEIFDYLRDAVERQDDDRLARGIFEAMRFKPIFLWPWRYAHRDMTIGKGSRRHVIKAGSLVLPSIRSAMFDTSSVKDPWAFNPARSLRDSFVFGRGMHTCIGQAMVRAQVGEAFRALFAKPGFRRAPGADGKLTRIGPNPDRLLVEFDDAPENRLVEHAMVTIAAPVKSGETLEAVRAELDALGNPARPDLVARLRESGIIHFTSASVVATGETASDPAPYIILEMSGDGDKASVIKAYAEAMGEALDPILRRFARDYDGSVSKFLHRRSVDISPEIGSRSGLVFAGAPGHSVHRIRAEASLALTVKRRIDAYRASIGRDGASDAKKGGPDTQDMEAEAILQDVRRHIGAQERFQWALAPAESRLESAGGSWATLVGKSLLSLPALAPILSVVAFFTMITYALQFDYTDSWWRFAARLGDSFILAVIGLVIVAGVLAGLAALWLNHIERREEGAQESIELDLLREIQAREDSPGHVQNHMLGVSTMKPGRFRAALLTLAFYIISIAATHAFRPGYLANINTIHFARWLRIKETGKLVFLSNYGGSWESYLEDFVAKASAGLTGIWSNTKGFPRARFLFLDGSRDGDRFKRWARAQQQPTSFWYSAYPRLNTTIIRKNSQIRQGLQSAPLNGARDWLALFSSMPRQTATKMAAPSLLAGREAQRVEPLETGDMQTIIFGPLGNLNHAAMTGVAVPDGLLAEQRLKLLEYMVAETSFGDEKPLQEAMYSALGPGGLTALGLPAEPGRDALASFPLAFRQGMADQYRSRVLDDVGASDPQVWRWGAQDNPVDVVLVSYADTEARLDAKLKRLDKVLRASGAKRVVRLSLTTNRQDKGAEDVASETPVKRERSEQQPREHFGFADGISQPVIRGVRHRRTHNSSPMHSIAAGEFVFGYRDEHGCFPPPPTVPSRFDQAGRLPAVDVSGAPSADRHAVRDFGRNGTFAVIRQLEQHVDAFNDYCKSRGDALGKTPEWVGSRIIGRWPNGSSVVRNPESAGSSLDNAFSYGEEDPQGRHCPLGAHVRRSNPRDSLGLDLDAQLRISKRHRILRAGRSYVDGKEKGLLFVCFNASIERQYEFIQQTWMSGMNFHGLRGEKDPLIGNHSQYAGRLTIQKWEGADELKRIPAFVTTRGGGYYFVPGQTALRFLRHRLAAQSVTPTSASATPARSRVSADPA